MGLSVGGDVVGLVVGDSVVGDEVGLIVGFWVTILNGIGHEAELTVSPSEEQTDATGGGPEVHSIRMLSNKLWPHPPLLRS